MANVRVVVRNLNTQAEVTLYQGADHTQAAALAAGIIAGGGYDALQMRCDWGGPTQQEEPGPEQQKQQPRKPAPAPEQEERQEPAKPARTGPARRANY